MLYGQEIQSQLFLGFPTFLYEIIDDSWAFLVPENHVRARSLVLSGFSFGCSLGSQRLPLAGSC